MSEMVFRGRARDRQVNLNVTSLIDVLFLLLIFFMLTGTFKRAGELELRLPDSSTASLTQLEQSHQVELVATEDGKLILEGERVELAWLKSSLLDLRAEDPERGVMIKAEAGVRHGAVITLLDIVRESGFRGVGIGTYVQVAGESQGTTPGTREVETHRSDRR